MNKKVLLTIGLIATVVSMLFVGCAPQASQPSESGTPAEQSGNTPAAAGDEVIKWTCQSVWPASLPRQQFLVEQWVKDVEELSNGRIDIDMYVAGEIVPAFECYEAVRDGTLDMSHSWAGYWIGKFPPATMFAATPAFMDVMGYMTWMYEGGGKELWQETYGDDLKVIPGGWLWAEGGGWSNSEITSLEDFNGVKYRTVLIWGEILSEMGAAVVTLPGGEIVPSLERGTLDAAEFSTPTSDWGLGFHEVADYMYFPGLHQIAGFNEVLLNKDSFNALPADLQAIVVAASDLGAVKAASTWVMSDCEVIEKYNDYGTTFMKYPVEMQQDIMDRFVDKYNNYDDAMFQKVWHSQKDFLKVYTPYKDLQTVEAQITVD